MSKPLRPKRGTTAENDAFTGLAYEVTLDTEKHRLRTHDGVTAGGYEHALVRDLPSAMRGATSSAAGKAGLVPAPAKGYQSRPLRGDGTWATSLACNITGLAAKATADAGGNTITTTYATKSEVSALQSAMEEDLNTVKEDVDNIPVVSSPDYSSGIALAQPGATEQTYTAPADGYIVYSILGFNNVFAKIYINNILVVNSGTTANTTYWPSTGQLRVSKNDVIKYSCNGERPENFMTFYPCKGA